MHGNTLSGHRILAGSSLPWGKSPNALVIRSKPPSAKPSNRNGALAHCVARRKALNRNEEPGEPNALLPRDRKSPQLAETNPAVHLVLKRSHCPLKKAHRFCRAPLDRASGILILVNSCSYVYMNEQTEVAEKTP